MSDTVSAQRQQGDIINLALGHPSPSLLPLALIRRAAEHRLSLNNPLVLQYGLEEGDLGFRTQLGEFLTAHAWTATHRAGRMAPEALFISAGVSGALDLICTVYTKPGDTVLVEEPTYFLALKIFADHHLRIVSVPTDENGLLVGGLSEQIRHEKPKLLYVVPSYQNPTGATLPEERRKRVAELCCDHTVLLLADEAYHLLGYDRAPPPSFASYAAEGNIFTLGSFSKILGPGLRLGWVHAHPDLLQRLITSGLYDSGGGTNPLTASIVRSVLELGLLGKHLQDLRDVLAGRREVLYEALCRELGRRYHVGYPAGGYFIWVRGPKPLDPEVLVSAAAQHQVAVMPGARCSSTGALTTHLRVSFSYYEPHQLREGARRLAEALATLD